MEEIKLELEKIKEILVADFNPLAIILFGSYARNTQSKDSDIDIAILSKNTDKKALFYEKQKLELDISKDIDLVNIMDENVSDGFKYEILMSGIVIHCTDLLKFDMLKLDMIREFLDFNEKRQDIIDRVKRGGDIYGK